MSSVNAASLDNLIQNREKLEELLEEYGNTLAPCIVEYEAETCEFPVEILNEIRAIYAHLYRASVSTLETDAQKNVDKALSHSKRAVIDGYKYLCVAYDDRYHNFFNKFKYINWKRSNLMNSIIDIDLKRQEAVSLLKHAKLVESTENGNNESNEDKCKELYKDAYSSYVELKSLLSDLEIKLASTSVTTTFPRNLFILILTFILGIFIGALLTLL